MVTVVEQISGTSEGLWAGTENDVMGKIIPLLCQNE